MNTNRSLIGLTIGLGLLNPIAALITTVEDTPNAEPVMLTLFVLPWLVAAELVRRGKTVAGAVLAGLLSLLNIVSFPGWTRTSVADWASQIAAGAGAVVCLALAAYVITRRARRSVTVEAAR